MPVDNGVIEAYLTNPQTIQSAPQESVKNDNDTISKIVAKIESLESEYDKTQGIERRIEGNSLIRDIRKARVPSKKDAKKLDDIGFQMQILNEYLAAAIVLVRIEGKDIPETLKTEINSSLEDIDQQKPNKKSVQELRQKLTASLESENIFGLYDAKTTAPETGEKTTRQGKYSKALACAAMERDVEYDLVTISNMQSKTGGEKTIVEITERLSPTQERVDALESPSDPTDKKLFDAYRGKFQTHVIPTYMRATVPRLPRHAFTSKLFSLEDKALEQISEQSRSAVPAYIPLGTNDGPNAQARGFEEAKKGTKALIKNLAEEMGWKIGDPPLCLNLLYSPTQKNGTHPYAYTTKVIDEALKELDKEGYQNIVIAKTPVNPWRFFEQKGEGIDYTGFSKSLEHIAANLNVNEDIKKYIESGQKEGVNFKKAQKALKDVRKSNPDLYKELKNLVECRHWIEDGLPFGTPHHKLAAKVKSACDATQFGHLKESMSENYKPPKFVSFCMEGKDRTTVSTVYTHALALSSKFKEFSIKDTITSMVKSGHNAMITTISIIGGYGQKSDSVNLLSSPDSSMKGFSKETAETKWKTFKKEKKKSFVARIFGSRNNEKSEGISSPLAK